MNWMVAVNEKLTNLYSGVKKRIKKQDESLQPPKRLKDGPTPEESAETKRERMRKFRERLNDLHEQCDKARGKTPTADRSVSESKDGRSLWDPVKEAGAEHLNDEGKVKVTMAYHQSSRKAAPMFPEEGAKKPKDMKEWVDIRKEILSEFYENKKPGVVYHGYISRYNVKSSDPNCRWVRVNFEDTEKRSCTLDESLRGEWWWYGHHGEEGKTRAGDAAGLRFRINVIRESRIREHGRGKRR